jgi:hypothetical protein
MAKEKTQMNGGRGLDEGGSEEINYTETNGAVPKGGTALFVTSFWNGRGYCPYGKSAIYCIYISCKIASYVNILIES